MPKFQTKKSLGQNFINDQGIIEAIADAAEINADDTVVEIGPGLGTLTEELASRAGKLVAVELDDRLIPILRAKFLTKPKVEIVHQNILEYDFSEVEKEGSLKIVGNLPYYITTPILLGILEKKVNAKSITAMVQKEVAERIVAKPNSKDYGVLSISLQYYCDCSFALNVPREYFSPVPKVDSAVVVLKRREESLGEIDFNLVKKAFMQRRKTLLNCLEGYKGKDKEELTKIFEELQIDPKKRPENLSVNEYIKLSQKF